MKRVFYWDAGRGLVTERCIAERESEIRLAASEFAKLREGDRLAMRGAVARFHNPEAFAAAFGARERAKGIQ